VSGSRPRSRAAPRAGKSPGPPGDRPGADEAWSRDEEGSGRAAATGPRLVDLCGDWLSLVAALRGASGSIDAAALRTRALELRDRFALEARAAGFAAADIEAATFAIVAFLDETVLSSGGTARDTWMARPLQLELFGIYTAGQDFFDRLDRMRREREARIEALEVCFACLALGFAGKYRLESLETLANLTGEVERDVAAVRGIAPGSLSPRAVRREELAMVVAESVPSWLAVAAFVVVVGLTWLVIFLLSRHDAASAARAIERLAG